MDTLAEAKRRIKADLREAARKRATRREIERKNKAARLADRRLRRAELSRRRRIQRGELDETLAEDESELATAKAAAKAATAAAANATAVLGKFASKAALSSVRSLAKLGRSAAGSMRDKMGASRRTRKALGRFVWPKVKEGQPPPQRPEWRDSTNTLFKGGTDVTWKCGAPGITCRLRLFVPSTTKSLLWLEVYDEDKIGSDDLIGLACVSLVGVEQAVGVEAEREDELVLPATGKHRGYIQYTLSWEPEEADHRRVRRLRAHAMQQKRRAYREAQLKAASDDEGGEYTSGESTSEPSDTGSSMYHTTEDEGGTKGGTTTDGGGGEGSRIISEPSMGTWDGAQKGSWADKWQQEGDDSPGGVVDIGYGEVEYRGSLPAVARKAVGAYQGGGAGQGYDGLPPDGTVAAQASVETLGAATSASAKSAESQASMHAADVWGTGRKQLDAREFLELSDDEAQRLADDEAFGSSGDEEHGGGRHVDTSAPVMSAHGVEISPSTASGGSRADADAEKRRLRRQQRRKTAKEIEEELLGGHTGSTAGLFGRGPVPMPGERHDRRRDSMDSMVGGGSSIDEIGVGLRVCVCVWSLLTNRRAAAARSLLTIFPG